MLVDGLVYRVDRAATQYWPSAYHCGDYRNMDVTIRNGTIHAGGIVGGCTDPLGTYRIEGVTAFTWGHAFTFETPATPGTGADRPPSGVTMILRNNRINPWPGRALQTIEMFHNTSRGNVQASDRYDVFVYDYQGQVGNEFRVYFREQATQALYGGLAPCINTTARPEIDGITCPMNGTPSGAPAAPIGLRITR